MDREQLWPFVVSIFIGALIGTERSVRHPSTEGDVAGLRTFILLAEAGAITGWLARSLDVIAVFLVGMACTTGMLAAAYVVRSRQEGRVSGYTTELAGGIVFLLGGATVLGHAPFAVAMAIVTSIVLATKDQLHASVQKLTGQEMRAALRLLFASFVVLPVLPREAVDPWGVLVPYDLWLLVILISGLSMAGYVAVRWTGAQRGALLTGALGGLVSSTAVTLSLARRSREVPVMAPVLGAGILLSWAVMFVRVLVEVTMVHPSLLRHVAPPLGGLAFFVAAFALATARRSFSEAGAAPEDALTKMKSPFQLRSAIGFSALFAVILLATKLVSTWLPSGGIYALAVLSGLVDVDAITLSVTGMAQRGEVSPGVATTTIVLATVANSAMKLGYVLVLGDSGLRRRLLVPGALVIAVGVLATVV